MLSYIKKAISMLRICILGSIYARKLIKRYADAQIVISYRGIGDIVLMLAYLDAYKKEHNKKNIKIISHNTDCEVYQYFNICKADLIPVKSENVKTINLFYNCAWGNFFRRKHPQILPITTGALCKVDLIDFNKYARVSAYFKEYGFKIPADTMPGGFHNIDCSAYIAGLVNDGVIKKGRTVLLNPYANSCFGVPFDLFEKIAYELQKRGLSIITSVHNGQKGIAGTANLDFSIRQSVSLCNEVGFVIGQRSGFMDLITFSSAHIICIDSDIYPHSDFYLLEDCWPQNKNIVTYRVREGGINIDEVLDKVIARCNEYFDD